MPRLKIIHGSIAGSCAKCIHTGVCKYVESFRQIVLPSREATLTFKCYSFKEKPKTP